VTSTRFRNVPIFDSAEVDTPTTPPDPMKRAHFLCVKRGGISSANSTGQIICQRHPESFQLTPRDVGGNVRTRLDIFFDCPQGKLRYVDGFPRAI
jgi:hypothetical protein